MVELVDLLRCQLPTVDVEVALDTLRCDGLGDDVPALLDTPQKEYLLRCLALALGNGFQCRVLVKRRVSATQAGVTR